MIRCVMTRAGIAGLALLASATPNAGAGQVGRDLLAVGTTACGRRWGHIGYAAREEMRWRRTDGTSGCVAFRRACRASTFGWTGRADGMQVDERCEKGEITFDRKADGGSVALTEMLR